MVTRIAIISLIITLFCGPLYSQDLRNRTERIYGNDTIISDVPLPDKVYRAYKNNLIVVFNFFEQQKGKKEKTSIFAAVGNGSVVRPGIILTNRHLLVMALKKLETFKKEQLAKGIVADYDYQILGMVLTEEPIVSTLSLNLKVYEDTASERDLMLLEIPADIMRKTLEMSLINSNDPSRIFLTTAKFADAKTGDEVYIVGSLYSDYDLFRHVFKSEVEAVLENMPANHRGLKRHYRLRGLRGLGLTGSAEPGFSGGPVLNKDGELIGVTTAGTDGMNFIYNISSSKDIKDFLKDNNIK